MCVAFDSQALGNMLTKTGKWWESYCARKAPCQESPRVLVLSMLEVPKHIDGLHKLDRSKA